VTLIRPLLDVSRREVLRYLEDIGQDYRADASNAESCYTRNRLRNELLPTIRQHFNSDVDQALSRLAIQAGDAQQFIAIAAAKLATRCVALDSQAHPRVFKINCRPLAGESALLVGEVCKFAWHRASWPLQAMGFQEWQQLATMVRGDHNAAAINLPGDIRARREGDSLVVERRQRTN
jgi:tRNA(Ile)-lysidine synthase